MQQDNGSKLKSPQSTSEWLKWNKIKVLVWPSLSSLAFVLCYLEI